MKKVIKLTEADLTNLVKKIIKENQAMVALQQATNEFNEKAEEDLSTEEFQEVVCVNPDTIDLPADTTNEQKQKVEEFKAKLKTASVAELKQAKRQLRELKRKGQQNEQIAGPAVISVLGVSMPPAFAIAIGGILLIMVLNILLKVFNIHLIRTVTSFCTGRQRTGYSIGFGRN
jgi:hypothetical protein